MVPTSISYSKIMQGHANQMAAFAPIQGEFAEFVSDLQEGTSIIDDDHELDRSTNTDKYKLIDLPLERLDNSTHEHMGVGMGPTLNTRDMSGLAPHEGSSTVLHLGADLCHGSYLTDSYTRHEK